MACRKRSNAVEVAHKYFFLVLCSFLFTSSVECRKARVLESVSYKSTTCRSHSASLTDFGGVGDGQTSNTKAFQAAIAKLSEVATDGGALLYVPPGKWLTGSFNLTSHFTLYLHKDAVIVGSQDISEWPLTDPLPSYGRGRDGPGGRYCSLIRGVNLTDVQITGDNGTIDGQGEFWWTKFHQGKLKYTRGYLIEIMYSDLVVISDITLLNSPAWNVHPVYSSNVIVKGITIIAPVRSPNTDGINPDSCSNVKIEDCYVVSGDDCVAIKSGWDEYGIAFGQPTEHVIIRRLTCVSPTSAVIALGSEMSGGISDIRAEDIQAFDSESGIRIKTAVGRGAYVKNIYAKGMNMHTMKWVFKMDSQYNSHPDGKYNPSAIPVVEDISYSDIAAENVTMAARLEGLQELPFKGICLSNVTIALSNKPKKVQWDCAQVEGVSESVTPLPCASLSNKKDSSDPCPYPTQKLAIDELQLQQCSLPTFK